MKTLLIPTDFDIQSLSGIPQLMQHYATKPVNLVLAHLMKITDNMQELLMLSRRSTEYQHISPEFYEACTALKQQHPGISNIRIEFFYGSTVAVFKNFLEAQHIDTIVMLEHYIYKMLNKNSINPALLVGRSGLPLITVNGQLAGQVISPPILQE
jgi:hypothetical protein